MHGVVWYYVYSCDGYTAAEVRVGAVTEEAKQREGKKKVRWKWSRAGVLYRCSVAAGVDIHACIHTSGSILLSCTYGITE